MSVENNYSLYVHINKINNKRYYGITSQKPKDRWRNGKGYKNHKNNKKDTYFYNAIRKYGWDNFKHEVLFEGLTKEEACLLEQCYIVLYDTTNRNKGYNRTTGGESFNHTDDTKKALSDLYKGENNPFYGKHHTEETKKMIGEKIKSERCGENHPMYGKKGILSPNYGKTFTEEHKKKISESHKGKNNPSSKSVYIIELNMTFDTITECAKYLNCSKNNISNVLRGKSKTAKGYHIIYAECK